MSLEFRHAGLTGVLALHATVAAGGDASPDPMISRAPFEVVDGGADCGADYQVKLKVDLRSADLLVDVSGAPEPVNKCWRTERRGSEVTSIEVPCAAVTLSAERAWQVEKLQAALNDGDASVAISGEICVAPWSQTSRVEEGTVTVKLADRVWDIPVSTQHSELRSFASSHWPPGSQPETPLLRMVLDCLPVHWPESDGELFFLRVSGIFALSEHSLDSCSDDDCFGATTERARRYLFSLPDTGDCTKAAATAARPN